MKEKRTFKEITYSKEYEKVFKYISLTLGLVFGILLCALGITLYLNVVSFNNQFIEGLGSEFGNPPYQSIFWPIFFIVIGILVTSSQIVYIFYPNEKIALTNVITKWVILFLFIIWAQIIGLPKYDSNEQMIINTIESLYGFNYFNPYTILAIVWLVLGFISSICYLYYYFLEYVRNANKNWEGEDSNQIAKIKEEDNDEK